MNPVQTAAKLYECRDACKKLWGNEWKKQIEFHTNLIKAAIKLVDDCKNMDGSGVFTMKCFAAAVELIEPS